jgi:hypothetical protein
MYDASQSTLLQRGMQTLALQHVVALRNSQGHELFDTRSGATYTFAAYSDF